MWPAFGIIHALKVLNAGLRRANSSVLSFSQSRIHDWLPVTHSTGAVTFFQQAIDSSSR